MSDHVIILSRPTDEPNQNGDVYSGKIRVAPMMMVSPDRLNVQPIPSLFLPNYPYKWMFESPALAIKVWDDETLVE